MTGVTSHRPPPKGTIETDLLQERRCAPLFQGFGSDRLEKFPKKMRRECGDAYLPVDQVRDFELRLGGGRVRRGSQLMRRQASYRLAEFFLPLLREPPAGLRFLLAALRELRGRDKIPVVLETRVTRGPSGFFRARRRRGEIHLVDTLSTPRSGEWENGRLDAATLYHEIGHNLMYHLYGRKFPDYGGHPGHDARATRYEDAATTPGAAWAEGFAGAIANLDYHSSLGIYRASELSEAWFEKPPASRLANEFVVAAILTDYVKSERPLPDGSRQAVADAASYRRLRKLFCALRADQVHEDFGIFIRAFLSRFPEERGRLLPILVGYGMADLLKNK